MQPQNALIYRQVITLRDGTRILLRPLTKDDRTALTELYATVTPDELVYFRQNVGDPQIVASWIDELDYERILPLVAVVGNQIVGSNTLHMGEGVRRHIGEVRIYLAQDYRGRGLGTKMIQAMIDIARKRGLLMLEAHVIREQTHIVRAFHNAGFVTKCVFEDAYLLPNGQLRDVDHMILRLRATDEEF